ncbi:MAG: hypothetical protein ACFFFH_05940 [Candidatus Thorarchaeota archaeon]
MQKINSFNLHINDEKVPTKKFVQQFIGNSLIGMVESLHLKDPTVHKITLEIKFDVSE